MNDEKAKGKDGGGPLEGVTDQVGQVTDQAGEVAGGAAKQAPGASRQPPSNSSRRVRRGPESIGRILSRIPHPIPHQAKPT